MKELAGKTLLVFLMLAAFTACGTIVLWIFDKLMNTTTDHLLFAGFKVGLVAMIMYGAVSGLSRRKKAKSE